MLYLSISLIIAWLTLFDDGLRLPQRAQLLYLSDLSMFSRQLPLRILTISWPSTMPISMHTLNFTPSWLNLALTTDSSFHTLTVRYLPLKRLLPLTCYCHYFKAILAFPDSTLSELHLESISPPAYRLICQLPLSFDRTTFTLSFYSMVSSRLLAWSTFKHQLLISLRLHFCFI